VIFRLNLFFLFLFFSPAIMSSNVPISGGSNLTAPTPQNTPLSQAPIALGLSRPTVPDITEDNEGEISAADGSEGPTLAGLEQHMLGMVHGKLADLLGKSSGYIESLPVEVKLNVEALKGVQVKQNELQNKYKRECLELEKKVSLSFFFFLIFSDFSRYLFAGASKKLWVSCFIAP
jgi:nucleosome assembly protein 1-like 1